MIASNPCGRKTFAKEGSALAAPSFSGEFSGGDRPGGYAGRALVIVLDSLGIGELPDARLYGDEGSNTLRHILEACRQGLSIPNLRSLGLLAAAGLELPPSTARVYGKAAEASPSKDTMVGHWELMGLIMDKPFPVYPQGFPQDIISRLEAAIGRRVLGNKPASGTEIIKELGETHLTTGMPIVYTSADSVFQIAAHEEVIPVDELYSICVKAREILQGDHMVGRVIARPFAGAPGSFYRTERRKDFAAEPPGRTVLDALKAAGREVWAIGKIQDIFSGRGITRALHTSSNEEGVEACARFLKEAPPLSLGFANLVDFDMLYGHRNDVLGYASALERFDERLGALLSMAGDQDVLLITADHGCDPTTASTDHSREYVPVLAWRRSVTREADLGTLPNFCAVGATVAEALGVPWDGPGESFYHCLEVDDGLV